MDFQRYVERMAQKSATLVNILKGNRILTGKDGSLGGIPLRYGPIQGTSYVPHIACNIGASEVIRAQSGRFVKNDGSGRAEIAVAATTELIGWLEFPEGTTSSTEGKDIGQLIPAAATNVIYRIPVSSGTYALALRYKTCDLAVASNIQGAALGASARDVIIIVGGDLAANKWVDVMINPAKVGATGVV
jgi:hypothetical protein